MRDLYFQLQSIQLNFTLTLPILHTPTSYINLTTKNFRGAFGTSVPLPEHTSTEIVDKMLFEATMAIYALDAFAIMVM